jgi:hypothetical protein
MRYKSTLRSIVILHLIILTAACGGSTQPDYSSDELVAPPVEGESGAPTLAATAAPDYNPKGLLVDPGDDSGLKFYNTSGQLIQSIDAEGITDPDPKNIFPAGSGATGELSMPLVYHSWEPEVGLRIMADNQTSLLRPTSAFFSMTGACGQAALAFSEIQIEESVPHSYLYAGSLDELETVSAFLEWEDQTTQMALMPVAVKAIGGNPKGVWYTHSAWGIGGVDLVFPITRGLFYYDLTSDENLTFLDGTRSFQGISPDMKFAGSVAFQPQENSFMQATNLVSNETVDFPLKTSSRRGAGYAVFSPDNQYIAWMEGSGSLASDPADFQAVVRVGSLTSGNVEIELDSAVAAQQIPDAGEVNFLKPVGWLDGQSLLMEAKAADWSRTYLLRLNLYDRTTKLFCTGSFVSFIYP